MTMVSKNWENFTSSLKGTARVILGQSFFINIALLAVPIYTLQIFDRVLLSGRIETLAVLLLGVLIVSLAAYYIEHLRRQTMIGFAGYLTDHIDPLLIGQSRKNASDRNLLLAVETFKQQLRSGSLTGLFDSLWIPIAIVVSFIIHPAIGFFVLLINAVLATCAWYKFKVSAPIERAQLAMTLASHEQLLTTPEQAAWLAQNNTTEAYRQGIKQQQLSLEKDTRASVLYLCQYAMKWLFQLGLPTVGAGLLLADQLSVGGFLAALIVASRTLMPLDAMISGAMSLQQNYELLPTLKAQLNQKTQTNRCFAGEFNGCLHIRNASTEATGFPHTALKQINLIAQSGDMIGLIGDTGSGVRDLTQLIMGQVQTIGGDLLFDGLRQRDWNAASLSQGIAWLPEDLTFPEQSIINMIAHHGQIDESHALKVAAETGLNAALIQWELDYSTIIREEWMNLRMGQQLQQLCLITALCTRTANLLLIEYPERYLSHEQLSQLTGYLQQLSLAGKTIIIATDSQLVLGACQSAYWLANGKVIQSGPSSNIKQQERANNVRSIK